LKNNEKFIRQSWFFEPNLVERNTNRFEWKRVGREGDMQRVLVVDDDRVVADTLTRIFERDGFQCRTAYGSGDALECARDFVPDLLLCDVSMPGRDGLALVCDITREFPMCRIIVLTAFYSNLGNVREQSDRLPRPMGILTKPCQPSELLREAAAMLATA
jgi:CheY-like chemotaxis protein